MAVVGSVKTLLELSVGLLMIAGVIYRLSKMESAIYFKIDHVNDYSKENIIKTNAQLEMINYKLAELSGRFYQIDRALRENNISVKVRKEDL